MKTNGLRNKKPQCARAAWRRWCADQQRWRAWWDDVPRYLTNWHRATWRK